MWVSVLDRDEGGGGVSWKRLSMMSNPIALVPWFLGSLVQRVAALEGFNDQVRAGEADDAGLMPSALSRAAAELGISRATIYRRMARLGITIPK